MADTPDIDVETAAFLTAFGAEMRRVREGRGWSRADLISASGLTVAVSTLAAQELGVRDMSATELSRYYYALGVDPTTAFDNAYIEVLGSTIFLYVDLTALAQTTTELLQPLRRWARARVDELPADTNATVPLTDSPLDDMADLCGVTRAELIHALRIAGTAHAPPGHPQEQSSAAMEYVLESPRVEEVLAQWPFLAPIVELPGPPWQFRLMQGGTLAGMRAYDEYAESLWIIDEHLVGLSRTPIRGRSGRVASTLDFAGSPAEVLAVLQEPVRWEDEP